MYGMKTKTRPPRSPRSGDEEKRVGPTARRCRDGGTCSKQAPAVYAEPRFDQSNALLTVGSSTVSSFKFVVILKFDWVRWRSAKKKSSL